MINYRRKENEEYEDYLCRICDMKPAIGSWQDVTNILNAELGYNYGESKYRKEYSTFSKIFNARKDKLFDEDFLKEIDDKMSELYKQQVKTRDAIREKKRHLEMKQESRHLSKVWLIVSLSSPNTI